MEPLEESLNAEPLSKQIRHWQTHQSYPKFLIFGLGDPATYSTTQRILNAGPDVWRQEWEYLRNVSNDSYSKVNVGESIDETLLEEIVAPWRFYWVKGNPASEATRFAQSMLAEFFRIMEDGADAAYVTLASDDNDAKPSRRCPWNRNLLLFLLPDAAERTAVLERASSPDQTSWVRHRALRWLCPLATQDEALYTWLQEFADEPDPLVRFWAAHCVCTGWIPCDPPPPPPSWVPKALLYGLTEDVLLDDWFPDEEGQREFTAEDLDRCGRDALQDAVSFLEDLDIPCAYTWWSLLKVIHRRNGADTRALRDGWSAQLPAANRAALQNTLALIETLGTTGELLNPELHDDAPPDSSGAAFPFYRLSDALTLKHCLDYPMILWNLHSSLTEELQRQQAHPGIDQQRLSQADALLAVSVFSKEEARANAALVTATIPFAIADDLVRNVETWNGPTTGETSGNESGV